jgi:hypothetical protein
MSRVNRFITLLPSQERRVPADDEHTLLLVVDQADASGRGSRMKTSRFSGEFA